MAGVKADYERVLKQRNALLKSAGGSRRGASDNLTSTLDVWDEQAATTGAELVAARIALVGELSELVTRSYNDIAGADAGATISYSSAIKDDTQSTSRVDWRAWLLEAFQQKRREELDRGITLVGPQRDDLSMWVNDHPAKGFASHGESWSFALSLRLASLAVLREDGVEPVLILDDVFAELDTHRRNHLTEQVLQSPQVLITAAVAEDIPVALGGRRVAVSLGQVGHD
jgi:DNA replication and repair protein RecF